MSKALSIPDQGRFVGREDALRQLQEAAEKFLNGKGSLILIEGEAGIGKTALINHSYNLLIGPLCRKAKREKNLTIKFIEAKCTDLASVGEPFVPFDKIITELVHRNPNFYKEALNQLGRSMSKISPRFGFFYDFVDLIHEWKKGKLTGENAVDIINRVNSRYIEFFSSIAGKTPLIIFIDDLHWADGPSINLLFTLSHYLESLPILMIGTYRPVEIESPSNPLKPLKKVISELRRHNSAKFITLKNLYKQEISEYIKREYPGLEDNKSFTDWLCKHTEGWPLFMSLIFQFLEEKSHIQLDQGRWQVSSAFNPKKVPLEVQDIILERLGLLDNNLVTVINYASVEGEEFHSTVLAKLLGVDHLEVLKHLTKIRQKCRLIEESVTYEPNNFDKNFKFSHTVYHQVIYDSLGEAEKGELHKKIAEIYEHSFIDQIDIPFGEIAVHYESAHTYHKAAKFRLRAGQKAWRICALNEAAYHTNCGLSNFGKIPEREKDITVEISLLDLDSNIRIHTMENLELAKSQMEKAIRLASESNNLHELLHMLLTLEAVYQCNGQNAPPDVLDEYNQAWEMAKKTGLALHMARCAGIFLKLRVEQDSRSVIKNISEALKAAEDQADSEGQVLAYFNLAQAYKIIGKEETSIHYYEQTLNLIEQGKNPQWLKKTTCLEDLAYFSEKKGEWKKAIDYCQQVVDLAREKEYRFMEAGLLNKISWLHFRAGNKPEANGIFQDAVDIARNAHSPHLLAEILANGIEYAIRGREVEKAEKLLNEFISTTQNTDISWMKQKIFRSKGLLYQLKGDLGKVEKWLQMAMDEAQKQGDEWAVHRYALDLAIAEYQLGDMDKAQSRALKVLELYQQRNTVTLAEANLLLARLKAGKGEDEDSQHYKQAAQMVLEELNMKNRLSELDDWVGGVDRKNGMDA
ncbi:MAG: AAA family ATPase [bacterium]